MLTRQDYERLLSQAAAASKITLDEIRHANGNKPSEALYVRDAVLAFLLQDHCPYAIAKVAGICSDSVRSSAVRHRRRHKAARRLAAPAESV